MSIVSIQSHVAYGHVGNSAAVFAIQRLGHEVWPVHLLQYSNHPGYGDHAGQIFGADDLRQVIAGMARRPAFEGCEALLSGYLPEAASAGVVGAALDALHAARADAVYCCDPVLGDAETGRYVPAPVADVLARDLVPRADVVTPNLFELGALTGTRPATRRETLAAARRLQAVGPALVLVTGVPALPGGALETVLVAAGGVWSVTTPALMLGRRPDGAGDLLSALFLAVYLRARDAPAALEHAVRATYDVLEETARRGARELALIAAQESLVAPRSRFAVVRCD